jgi:putative oxidoreductase
VKKFLFGSAPGFIVEITVLLLRVSSGLMMALLHGWAKVPPSEKFITGVTELGFPAPLFFAWCAGLAELVGGLLIAVGLFTRPAALFLAFTMGVAAFGRHLHDPFDRKELSLLYLGISLLFLAYGAGKVSLDRFLGGK